jgi:hypothetical protein
VLPDAKLHNNADEPTAVLYPPVVTVTKAQAPNAVLWLAVVLFNAACPTAVFRAPVEHYKVLVPNAAL